jgi:hypothetical protein
MYKKLGRLDMWDTSSALPNNRLKFRKCTANSTDYSAPFSRAKELYIIPGK